MSTQPRGAFSSRFGVIAATLGSAVGLGNIWRFPYETGNGGGAGFLLIYILASLIVGLPVMMAEIALGRAARTDPVGTFRTLTPNTRWWLTGVVASIGVVLILSFYSDVVGWVFAYIAKAIGGDELLTQDQAALEDVFNGLLTNPIAAVGWQWLVLLVIGGILALGVTKGIEAVTKRLMPALAVLLVVIAVKSLTMPGAIEGVKFLFVPKFSDITTDVVLTALGLAFFKLSLGVGAIMVYGSYFRDEQNIPRTALTVMFADLSVSLLAGLAIFPAVFALGFDPASGPSLLFQTIPAVFAGSSGGRVLLVVFFVLTGFAATGAMLSLMEVPVAIVSERFGMSRRRAVAIVIGGLAMTGALAALSFSTLSGVTVGGKNLFDAFDIATSKFLLPIGGVLTSLYISFGWGKERLISALTNDGTLNNERTARLVAATLQLVTPLVIVVILVAGVI